MGSVPRRRLIENVAQEQVHDLTIPDDLSIPAFLRREFDPSKILPGMQKRPDPTTYRPRS